MCERAIIISSTCVSSGKWAGSSPGSILLSVDIRKGVLLLLSRRKQAWQISSFSSISNHRSWQRLQVSILTWSIAVWKACIYPYCLAGRKPVCTGRGRGGGRRRNSGSGGSCGRDSVCGGRLGACIDGSGRVLALLDRLLGRNGCCAVLFLDFSRQVIQVEKTLLPGLAEASFKK